MSKKNSNKVGPITHARRPSSTLPFKTRHSDVRLRTVTAAACLFPMWALKVSDFMNMKPGDHFNHQDLRKQGKLVGWDAKTMGPCAFISHQWVSWKEADPSFRQLGVLQSFIRRLTEGEIQRVRPSWLTELIFPGLRGLERTKVWIYYR